MSSEDSSAKAVRSLRRSYRVGALVDTLAAIGMAVPRLRPPEVVYGTVSG